MSKVYVFKQVEVTKRDSCEGCYFESSFDRERAKSRGYKCSAGDSMDCCPETSEEFVFHLVDEWDEDELDVPSDSSSSDTEYKFVKYKDIPGGYEAVRRGGRHSCDVCCFDTLNCKRHGTCAGGLYIEVKP